MTHEQVATAGLEKMFEAVGMKYPNKRFTNRDGWYTRRTWTQAQEDTFHKWFTIFVRRHLGLSVRAARIEVSWFLLMWGWKVKDP